MTKEKGLSGNGIKPTQEMGIRRQKYRRSRALQWEIQKQLSQITKRNICIFNFNNSNKRKKKFVNLSNSSSSSSDSSDTNVPATNEIKCEVLEISPEDVSEGNNCDSNVTVNGSSPGSDNTDIPDPFSSLSLHSAISAERSSDVNPPVLSIPALFTHPAISASPNEIINPQSSEFLFSNTQVPSVDCVNTAPPLHPQYETSVPESSNSPVYFKSDSDALFEDTETIANSAAVLDVQSNNNIQKRSNEDNEIQGNANMIDFRKISLPEIDVYLNDDSLSLSPSTQFMLRSLKHTLQLEQRIDYMETIVNDIKSNLPKFKNIQNVNDDLGIPIETVEEFHALNNDQQRIANLVEYFSTIKGATNAGMAIKNFLSDLMTDEFLYKHIVWCQPKTNSKSKKITLKPTQIYKGIILGSLRNMPNINTNEAECEVLMKKVLKNANNRHYVKISSEANDESQPEGNFVGDNGATDEQVI